MIEHSAVRCSNHRSHGNYDTCGRLLCVLQEGKIYLYCPICQTFVEMTILENDNVELKSLPKKTKFNLKTKLRLKK